MSETGSPLSQRRGDRVTDSGDATSTDIHQKSVQTSKVPVDVGNNAGGDTGETTDDDEENSVENNTNNIPDITIDDEGNFFIKSDKDENNESLTQYSVKLNNVANGCESSPLPSDQSNDAHSLHHQSKSADVQITETKSSAVKTNLNNIIGEEMGVLSKDVTCAIHNDKVISEKPDQREDKEWKEGEEKPDQISETEDKERIEDEEKPDQKSETENKERKEDEEMPDQKSDGDEEEEKEEKPDAPLDILGNGLLVKKVISPAEDDRIRPSYGDIATLRSEGVLEDGTVVDKHESITFTVGDGDVIQAWDLCTALMGVGEVCELTTAAKYAYGSLGRPPSIPASAKITYTLELLKKEPGLDLSKLSVEERLKFGDEKRERGNYLFGRTDYNGAINSYSKALKILDDEHSNHSEDVSLLQKLVDTRMKCYNNIAAAQLKVEAYNAAIRSCDEVLKIQPENVKALFRKGKAHAGKGNTELAIVVLKKAVQLDPESKIVQQELFKQTKKLKKETESEKEMYMKMFGSAKTTNTEKNKSGSQWKTWGLIAVGSVTAVLFSLGIAAYRNMKN